MNKFKLVNFLICFLFIILFFLIINLIFSSYKFYSITPNDMEVSLPLLNFLFKLYYLKYSSIAFAKVFAILF